MSDASVKSPAEAQAENAQAQNEAHKAAMQDVADTDEPAAEPKLEDTPTDQLDLSTVKGRDEWFKRTYDIERSLELAREHYEREPENVEVALCLARNLRKARKHDEMMEVCNTVLAKQPHHVRTHITIAMAKLAEGEYREGWKHYAYREGMKHVFSPDKNLPMDRRWKGEPVRGKPILLVGEQGLGDTLQFVRYAINLREHGARPILKVQKGLRTLFQHSAWLGKSLTAQESAPIAHWIYMSDLIPAFSATINDVPWPGAYVAEPAVAAPFTAIRHQGLRVGIAWKGNPKQPGNWARSIKLDELAFLFDTPNTTFYNLLPPKQSTDLDDLGLKDKVVDISEATVPFENLARAVSNMDLVITVCTSIAHLAASMGKPTWLMLSYLPDWRWQYEGESSKWYPSIRLFRQRTMGDWSPVLADVRKALEAA